MPEAAVDKSREWRGSINLERINSQYPRRERDIPRNERKKSNNPVVLTFLDHHFIFALKSGRIEKKDKEEDT